MKKFILSLVAFVFLVGCSGLNEQTRANLNENMDKGAKVAHEVIDTGVSIGKNGVNLAFVVLNGLLSVYDGLKDSVMGVFGSDENET